MATLAIKMECKYSTALCYKALRPQSATVKDSEPSSKLCIKERWVPEVGNGARLLVCLQYPIGSLDRAEKQLVLTASLFLRSVSGWQSALYSSASAYSNIHYFPYTFILSFFVFAPRSLLQSTRHLHRQKQPPIKLPIRWHLISSQVTLLQMPMICFAL